MIFPPGTIIATFSGSGTSYRGQHGLWYTSNCSFGKWTGISLTLNATAVGVGSTLTAVFDEGYPDVTFTKVAPAVGDSGGGPPPDTDIGGSLHARVVEGIASRDTVNPWVATFNDQNPKPVGAYRAHVDWGDGTAGDGQVTAAGNPKDCNYEGNAQPGQCFIVSGAHRYAVGGAHAFTVTVRKGGGPVSDRGIAEIIPRVMQSRDRRSGAESALAPAIGTLTFVHGGRYFGCTGEALAGLSVVLTAKHCAADLAHNTDNDRFEFAPAERGDCWQATSESDRRPLSNCRRPSEVAEPYGYWCARSSDVYRDPSNNEGPAFIVMSPCGPTAGSLQSAGSGGIAITFNSYRGGNWTALGYPLYDPSKGGWSLRSCSAKDQSGGGTNTSERDGPLFGPCSALGSGVSGGPWVNQSVLSGVYGIGAINEKLFPPSPSACSPPNEASRCNYPLPNGQLSSQTSQSGSYLGDTAMQEYIRAALAANSDFPMVSGASVTNRHFRVGSQRTIRVARVKYGTVFRYALDRPAAVTIAIERLVRARGRRCPGKVQRRRSRSCRLTQTVGTLLRRHGREGENRTRFSGRIGRRALAPGRYWALIKARERAGHLSLSPPRIPFVVVR